MSGGHNRKFLADPAGYAHNKTILVPDHSAGGFWSAVQQGPFDLAEFEGSGFAGTVLVLNHMTRRAKAQTSATRPIPGIWVPYADNKLIQARVTASTIPYFVFTSKLGGCAIGIQHLNMATTTFSHDATSQQTANLGQAAVTLFHAAYDPNDTGMNVSAFFWWDGAQWRMGRSATYNAHYHCQPFGADKYPKKM
jgi:hypothetical protein